jgi:hypothetical protein
MIALTYNGGILCFRPEELIKFYYNAATDRLERKLVLYWRNGLDTVILGEESQDCYHKLHKHYGVK